MSLLRVLHIMDVDKRNYYLSNLASHTDEQRVEYSFATLAPPTCDLVMDFKSRGWDATGLGFLGRRKFPQAYFALRKLITDIGPDIVHTHTFDPSLLGLTAAKRAGLTTVLTRHHSEDENRIAGAHPRSRSSTRWRNRSSRRSRVRYCAPVPSFCV